MKYLPLLLLLLLVIDSYGQLRPRRRGPFFRRRRQPASRQQQVSQQRPPRRPLLKAGRQQGHRFRRPVSHLQKPNPFRPKTPPIVTRPQRLTATLEKPSAFRPQKLQFTKSRGRLKDFQQKRPSPIRQQSTLTAPLQKPQTIAKPAKKHQLQIRQRGPTVGNKQRTAIRVTTNIPASHQQRIQLQGPQQNKHIVKIKKQKQISQQKVVKSSDQRRQEADRAQTNLSKTRRASQQPRKTLLKSSNVQFGFRPIAKPLLPSSSNTVVIRRRAPSSAPNIVRPTPSSSAVAPIRLPNSIVTQAQGASRLRTTSSRPSLVKLPASHSTRSKDTLLTATRLPTALSGTTPIRLPKSRVNPAQAVSAAEAVPFSFTSPSVSSLLVASRLRTKIPTNNFANQKPTEKKTRTLFTPKLFSSSALRRFRPSATNSIAVERRGINTTTPAPTATTSSTSGIPPPTLDFNLINSLTIVPPTPSPGAPKLSVVPSHPAIRGLAGSNFCDGGNDLGFCERRDTYPGILIESMMSDCEDLLEHMYAAVPGDLDVLDSDSPVAYAANISYEAAMKGRGGSSPEWSWSSYKLHKGPLCDSHRKFMSPNFARDVGGRWLVVVQTAARPQRVVIDMCRRAGEQCRHVGDCGLKSRCLQTYNYHVLMALEPDMREKCPKMAVFKFPSGCRCHVETATATL